MSCFAFIVQQTPAAGNAICIIRQKHLGDTRPLVERVLRDQLFPQRRGTGAYIASRHARMSEADEDIAQRRPQRGCDLEKRLPCRMTCQARIHEFPAQGTVFHPQQAVAEQIEARREFFVRPLEFVVKALRFPQVARYDVVTSTFSYGRANPPTGFGLGADQKWAADFHFSISIYLE